MSLKRDIAALDRALASCPPMGRKRNPSGITDRWLYPQGGMRHMDTLKTTAWGQTWGVRANFAEASACVEVLSEDGWRPTLDQVADFRHRPLEALRAHLVQIVRDSGDDPDDPTCAAEIDAALRRARETT